MKHFSDLLEKTLKKRHLYTEAKASYVIEKMKQILNDHFGEETDRYVEVIRFYEKKITLKTHSSSWKHLLTQHKKSFLLLLQSEFSVEEIQDINIF